MNNKTIPANLGAVVSVRGSVVDIRFDTHLPPIHSLLHAKEGAPTRQTRCRTREGCACPDGSRTDLFIDGEELPIEMGREMMEHLRYGVTGRTSSCETHTLFKEDPVRFDLVIYEPGHA